MPAGPRETPGGPLLPRVVAGHAPQARPRRGQARPEAAQIGRAALLVIDELGFLPLDADGARLVFQVFADAYERQSVVIHDEPGVLALGVGVRRRPDGGGGHRPHRAPRQARAVQGRAYRVPGTPSFREDRSKNGCVHPVRTLLKSKCTFCSKAASRRRTAGPGPASGRRRRSAAATSSSTTC